MNQEELEVVKLFTDPPVEKAPPLTTIPEGLTLDNLEAFGKSPAGRSLIHHLLDRYKGTKK